ncbi:LOW QUALITY PROTEIN: putative magnesium transporter NIPA8 [Curcuma longa]|uniref:LOW QUALITY PROTEIN: putative magnesium transporter NIPA8 n=1 Tax=Curcuma longa TaxID=136217 RepID=UPI003D9F16FF
MGEWIVGAVINIIGSIAINVGTNLLKLGHDERERYFMLINDGSNSKLNMKSIIHFQTWRIGILLFAFGNCLNFFSFAYAAQSLLAALGSIQFVSNIIFAYFVLNKTVSFKVILATSFIVLGNIFLVSFGNHQSPVFTPEQLIAKYTSLVFLLYCFTLLLVVSLNQYIYRKGEAYLAVSRNDSLYWSTLLPFSYATVSGAVGSCSVLFAKSLSNLLRLTMSSKYQFHCSWFAYCILLLFLCTAGFWMARLNEGLSLFDAILIVPMFQIAWTFFSICTGFVYFQEYQVFNTLRTTMFVMGMACVFVGISLLAPDDTKGCRENTSSLSSAPSLSTDMNRSSKILMEDTETNPDGVFSNPVLVKARHMLSKAKAVGSFSLGLGEDSPGASSVLVALMPVVSSRTTGFRDTIFDRTLKFIPLRNSNDTEM